MFWVWRFLSFSICTLLIFPVSWFIVLIELGRAFSFEKSPKSVDTFPQIPAISKTKRHINYYAWAEVNLEHLSSFDINHLYCGPTVAWSHIPLKLWINNRTLETAIHYYINNWVVTWVENFSKCVFRTI